MKKILLAVMAVAAIGFTSCGNKTQQGEAADSAAVAAAVSAITDVEPANVVNGLLEQVGDAATDAKDAAVDAVNEKVDEAKQAAEDKANEVKDAAKQKANDAIDNAASDVKKGLGL